MSTTKQITVWCDADDCGEWEQVCERSIAKARREVRGRGWRHSSGKDYCPFHKEPARRGLAKPQRCVPR